MDHCHDDVDSGSLKRTHRKSKSDHGFNVSPATSIPRCASNSKASLALYTSSFYLYMILSGFQTGLVGSQLGERFQRRQSDVSEEFRQGIG